MAPSPAMTKVQQAESACWAAAASVREPDDIPASEAVRLYETLERAGRAIAAGKTLLAKRVAASEQWKRKGHGSAAEHLAQISGRSLGSAKSELETSDALTPTLHGWALVPGTGKRAMVAPDDLRHPANAPPPATGPPGGASEAEPRDLFSKPPG